MSRKKRFSKHYQAQATPDQLGLLMELHRQAKELSVVIQFLCTSTTGNQSVTYQDNAYTQADVLNLYQDLGSALRDAKKTLGIADQFRLARFQRQSTVFLMQPTCSRRHCSANRLQLWPFRPVFTLITGVQDAITPSVVA